MSLTFKPISSPGGNRDYSVDLTGALEDSELLTKVEVTSSRDDVLKIRNGKVNTVIFADGGTQVAIGKGAVFSVETIKGADLRSVPICIDFVGDSGTAGTEEVIQPVFKKSK